MKLTFPCHSDVGGVYFLTRIIEHFQHAVNLLTNIN